MTLSNKTCIVVPEEAPSHDTATEPVLTSTVLPQLMILLPSAGPGLTAGACRQAVRDLGQWASREPLAGLVGWVLVAFGCALWVLATGVLSPGVDDGVCAAEGWLATAAGGPVIAASMLLRQRRDSREGS